MGKVTLEDFDKRTAENGEDVYTLSNEAGKRHGKKKLAGIPKTVTVHKPDDGEPIAKVLAESACKVLAKRCGVD